jgi:hypothetical protein
MGWDSDDDVNGFAMDEVCARHGWGEEEKTRLRLLHYELVKAFS